MFLYSHRFPNRFFTNIHQPVHLTYRLTLGGQRSAVTRGATRCESASVEKNGLKYFSDNIEHTYRSGEGEKQESVFW